MSSEERTSNRFRRAIHRLRVPHQWGEPLPAVGWQVLFSPGGPLNLGLHIGLVRREADGSVTAYGYYPRGHEPGGTNTDIKRRVLMGEDVEAYLCNAPSQMTPDTVYVDLELSAEETARVDAEVAEALNGGPAAKPLRYQFYVNNCAHWCAVTLNKSAGMALRDHGVMACAWCFARIERALAGKNRGTATSPHAAR